MSAVPAAIEGMVALFTRELTGTQVLDGPPAVDVRGDVVIVGFTPEDVSLNAVSEIAGLGSAREAFDVYFIARSWSGTADIAAQRRRTYDLLDKAKSALLVDPTLSGAVSRARYAGHVYAPSRNETQLIVDVIGQVEVRVL